MIMRGKYEMEYEAHDLVYRGKKVLKKTVETLNEYNLW